MPLFTNEFDRIQRMNVDEYHTIRPLVENDLSEADRIFRLSLAHFCISDPMTFGGDTDYVKSRFYSDHLLEICVRLMAVCRFQLYSKLGSVGFFGPLTVS